MKVPENYIVTHHLFAEQEIQLYLLPVQENISRIDMEIIPPSQVAELSRYKIEVDVNKRLLARSFLFSLLLQNTSIKDFELGFGYYKKPFLKSAPEIQFSFSYSQDFLLLGVCTGKNIGVDIEHLDRGINMSEVIPSMFCARENAIFNSLSADADKQRMYFFNLFAAKESMLKAMGTGLHFDATTFNLHDSTLLFHNSKTYRFFQPAFGLQGYAIAVSYEVQ